jgi:hypothetical protein
MYINVHQTLIGLGGSTAAELVGEVAAQQIGVLVITMHGLPADLTC